MMKKLLAIGFLVSAFFVYFSPQSAYATTGLSAGWAFDEGSGTTVNDAAKNNNVATLQNSPTRTAAKYLNGLSFDGTNDYVTASNSSSLTPVIVTEPLPPPLLLSPSTVSNV